MPWFSEDSKEYWLPDEMPEKGEMLGQLGKRYLRPDGAIVSHPRWTFDSGAFVSDEYLYRNEGWTHLVETSFKPVYENGVLCVTELPKEKWSRGEPKEYTLVKTYDVVETVDDPPEIGIQDPLGKDIGSWPTNNNTRIIKLNEPRIEQLDDRKVIHIEYKKKRVIRDVPAINKVTHVVRENPEEEWIVEENEIFVTYTISAIHTAEHSPLYNTDLVDTDNDPYNDGSLAYIKSMRNMRLQSTDYAFAIAIEKGLTISDKLKKYRDDLRDITDNLTDLEHVEWPRKPHYPEEFFNETFK